MHTKDHSNVKGIKDTQYRFQCINCYVSQRHQRWCLQLLCNTVNRVILLILLMSKVSKVSNTMYCTLYTALLTFLDLSTIRVIAGKTHSQSPFLKTKGVLSNPVILRYLWEQSCILHTLTKLPACNLDLKSIFNA